MANILKTIYKFRPVDKCPFFLFSVEMLEDVEQQPTSTGETRPEQKPALTPAQVSFRKILL